jgi:hypothetical protein
MTDTDDGHSLDLEWVREGIWENSKILEARKHDTDQVEAGTEESSTEQDETTDQCNLRPRKAVSYRV